MADRGHPTSPPTPEPPGRAAAQPSAPTPAAPTGRTDHAQDSPGQAKRRSFRDASIRTRIVALLMAPVMVTLVLGWRSVQQSWQTEADLRNISQIITLTGVESDAVLALQREADTSALSATGVGQHIGGIRSVQALYATTDAAFGKLVAQSNALATSPALSATPGVAATLRSIATQKDLITKARANAYTLSVPATVNDYDTVIRALESLPTEIAPAFGATARTIQGIRTLSSLSQAKEAFNNKVALFTAGLAEAEAAKRGGAVTTDVLEAGSTAGAVEANELTQFTAIVGPANPRAIQAAQMLDAQHNAQAAQVQKDETAILANRADGPTIGAQTWFGDTQALLQQMHLLEDQLVTDLQQSATTQSSNASQDALVYLALIIAMVILGYGGSLWVARGIIVPLRTLQEAAQDIAIRRLPTLVRKLAEGRATKADFATVSVDITSNDEVGKVARSFEAVYQQAVRLADEQSLQQNTTNAMFGNISRRTLGLAERQLLLISELERQEPEPDRLGTLFRLDHLVTRMRRNSENLLVLADEEPGRRSNRTPPLVDVLRAAAAEVEQYERIDVKHIPPITIGGHASTDIVHMISELLENATASSSPQSRVTVTADVGADDTIQIAIKDAGFGQSPDDLATINTRLASRPAFDESASRHMGLFVVARLAHRHAIRVHLSRNADQDKADTGLTATVVLPVSVTAAGAGRTAPPPLRGSQATTPPAYVPRISEQARPAGAPQSPPSRGGHARPNPDAPAPLPSRARPPQQVPSPLPRSTDSARGEHPGTAEAEQNVTVPWDPTAWHSPAAPDPVFDSLSGSADVPTAVPTPTFFTGSDTAPPRPAATARMNAITVENTPPVPTQVAPAAPDVATPPWLLPGDDGLAVASAQPAMAPPPPVRDQPVATVPPLGPGSDEPAPQPSPSPRAHEPHDPIPSHDRPQETAIPWTPSPNDSLRERALQASNPVAGSLTASGLPRRIPRANLVPGKAVTADDSHDVVAVGPQISRAAPDVQARMSNIQAMVRQAREQARATSEFPVLHRDQEQETS